MPRRVAAWFAAAVVAAGLLAAGRDARPLSPQLPPWRTEQLDLTTRDPAIHAIDRLMLHEQYGAAWTRTVAELRESAQRNGPFAATTLERLQWLAGIAVVIGDVRVADEILDALLGLPPGPGGPDRCHRAEILLRRGRLDRARGDHAGAERAYRAGRGLAIGGLCPRLLLGELARAEGTLLRTRDRAAGLAHSRSVLRAAAEDRFRSLAMRSGDTAWLAWSELRAGRPDLAREACDRGEEILRTLGLSGDYLGRVLGEVRADAFVLDGRWDLARPLLHRVLADGRAARHHLVGGGYGRRGVTLRGHELLALDAVLHGEGEEAWRVLQRGRAVAHVEAATLARWSAVEPDTFRRVDVRRRRLLDLLDRLDAHGRRGSPVWGPATWRLYLAILRERGEVHAQEQAFLGRRGLPEPSLEDVVGALGPRTALVGTLVVQVPEISIPSAGPKAWGYLYVLRRDRSIQWVKLWEGSRPPDETEAGEWGGVFVRILGAAAWQGRVDLEPALLDQLRTWTRHYLDPALPLLSGIDHVVIEGLQVPVEAYRDAHGRYLLDRFDVSYTPSATLLAILDASPPRPVRNDAAALVVSPVAAPGESASIEGAPPVASARPRTAAAPVALPALRPLRRSFRRADARLAALPPLVHAVEEAVRVAGHFSQHVLVTGSRVEAQVGRLAAQGDLRRFPIVHLAGHTLTDFVEERCGVAVEPAAGVAPDGMGDGVLDVKDVLLGWRLDADLVTLAGCDTAIAGGRGRDEERGFTPALMSVGARRVLVSLYPVDDRATSLLMDRFYRNLTEGGMPPARALREAKVHLRDLHDGSGGRPYEHPAFWSGFVLVGAR